MDKLATLAGPAKRLGVVGALAALIAESHAGDDVKVWAYVALGVAYLAQSSIKAILAKPKPAPFMPALWGPQRFAEKLRGAPAANDNDLPVAWHMPDSKMAGIGPRSMVPPGAIIEEPKP